MKKVLLAVLIAGAFVSLPLFAVEYDGGRCNGRITLYYGDNIRFTPGLNPAPGFLWILAQSGQGYLNVEDSAGGTTLNLYVMPGDVILFSARYWIDFFLDGTSLEIYYGGANLNPPQAPVCSTGSLGPVLLLTTELRNVAIQSGASGPPDIRVVPLSNTSTVTDENLTYWKLSGALQGGTFKSTACAGSTCCNPTRVTFPIKNLSGASFTGYVLDSENQSDFDWKMTDAPPLTCTAEASPTSGTAPVTVSFSAAAIGGSGGFTYDWRFGDGKFGQGQGVSHTYKAGGTFKWKMTVTDLAGKSCDKSGTITVTSPLTLNASSTPRQGDPPLAVSFSAVPKGGKGPYSYNWEFGDGKLSEEESPEHTYENAGKWIWSVNVTDSESREAFFSDTVFCGFPVDPTILAVVKLTSPFRLKVAGADFESGCKAFIDGVAAPQTIFKSPEKLILKGAGLKEMLPKGVPKCVTVQNLSGGVSACFIFTR